MLPHLGPELSCKIKTRKISKFPQISVLFAGHTLSYTLSSLLSTCLRLFLHNQARTQLSHLPHENNSSLHPRFPSMVLGCCKDIDLSNIECRMHHTKGHTVWHCPFACDFLSRFQDKCIYSCIARGGTTALSSPRISAVVV